MASSTPNASDRRASTLTACALAGAGAAWWALFHFGGVTDIGYDASAADPSAFSWIAHRWREDFRHNAYAVNFLAPLVALWLAWRRRARWTPRPLRPSLAGFCVLLAGLALHAVGAKAQQTRLTLLAMIVTLWGLAWFAWGRPAGRALAMPAFAMLFALPLNFFDAALNMFRVASVAAAAGVAAGLGMPVAAAGSLLIDGETRAWAIDMADATNSVFALAALTLWSVALAELTLDRANRRALLIAATPLLFWIANAMRGVGLCLIAEGVSPEAAARGHDAYPGLMLAAAFLPLQALAVSLLRKRGAEIKARLRSLARESSARPTSNSLEGLP